MQQPGNVAIFLSFGILVRWYFYILVISILIVGEIFFFFLNVEDDDHLSSGFTENGARKGGLNFYRLAFFQKGKVLQSFALPLGQEKAGKCWQTQGRGLAGSAIKQGDEQAHTRNVVRTEMPRGAEGQGSVQEVGKGSGTRKSRPGNKVRNQAKGSVTERTQKSLESLTREEQEQVRGQVGMLRGHEIQNQTAQGQMCCRASYGRLLEPLPHISTMQTSMKPFQLS